MTELQDYLQNRINELRLRAYKENETWKGYELQGMIMQVIHTAKEFEIDIDTNVDVLKDD